MIDLAAQADAVRVRREDFQGLVGKIVGQRDRADRAICDKVASALAFIQFHLALND